MISIYDSEQYDYAFKIANILGATVTDSIVPFFTTHVIAEKLTPHLRTQLNIL